MKLFKKLILGGLALLSPLVLISCMTEEPVDLKFKTAVLTSKAEELTSKDQKCELTIKASVNGEVGKVYAVLTDTKSTPTPEEIVSGGETWVWVGDSGETQSLDTTISNLAQGKEYFAYFVINYKKSYSEIVSKSATTMEFVDKGEGTQENPFKVSTVEDLEHVGTGPYDKYNLDWKAEETYYVLENDIDLTAKYGKDKESWTPLSLGKDATFDGQGHTITGLYIDKESTVNLGLFSGINIGGTVKNLKLTNVRITTNGFVEVPKQFNATLEGDARYINTNVEGAKTSGIYVGALTGDCKGTIENVVVTDAILKVAGSRVGGLTGRIYGDEGTAVQVNNVYVEATIEGVSRLGGIVGLIDAKSKATFETPVIKNAMFKGTIKGSTEFPTENSYVAGEYLGGFAGYARAFEASNIVVDATIEGFRHAGGVVGFLQYNANVPNFSVLKDSLFKGNVSVEYGSNAGPIVGNRSTSKATEENCVAEGWYLATSKFIKKETEMTFDGLPATAKWGSAVEALTAEWFAQNLPNLDLTDFFKLDANHFPALK